MNILITNIKELIHVETTPRLFVDGEEMKNLSTLKNAFLLIEDSKIKRFGTMSSLNNELPTGNCEEINAAGKMVFPCFCDSHTHLVYAGSREMEFVDKIKGLSYKEINKRGGGIQNSAAKLHNTSEIELTRQAFGRLEEIARYGTGAVEIKSGYGLTLDDEIKMLRVIRGLKASSPITIKATFLGAHAVPPEYKSNRKGYVDLIINQMIPRVADEGLADFIDVFCDKGFFTPEETDRILDAGSGYGLIPKIHANELGRTGGVPVAVKYNSLSVDHLEFIDDNDIKALLNIKHSSFNIHHSLTMPTLLPSTAFFLGLNYSPARRIIESGLPVALASDFNPGTSPSGNMQFVMSLACIKLRLTPEEAINAATLNSAYAMGVSNSHGSIAVGKSANIFITKEIPSYQFMPYSYGNNKVESVILNGKLL